MILAPTIVARLVALGILTALLQLAFFAKLSFLGASPDFAALVVLSLGLLGGSLSGAVAGFSIGLLIDALLLQTLGATALVLLTVGYLAGRYRETVGLPTRGGLAVIGGALTLLAALSFALIQVMLGVEADVSPLVARDIIVVSVLGMILAVPVHTMIRLLLRSALIDDRPTSRRPVTPATASSPPTTTTSSASRMDTPHDVSV